MGLDMYLKADVYVPQTNFENDEFVPNPDFEAIVRALNLTHYETGLFGGGISVDVPMGYWRKANAIQNNPNVSLLFPWYAMERQVSVTGVAKKVSAEESDAYFASRPRESQLGAWASSQSEKLISRIALEEKFAEFSQKFPSEVPRPPHWGGYLVTPITFEFWQGRYSRLHDRFIYTKNNSDWELVRLNP